MLPSCEVVCREPQRWLDEVFLISWAAVPPHPRLSTMPGQQGDTVPASPAPTVLTTVPVMSPRPESCFRAIASSENTREYSARNPGQELVSCLGLKDAPQVQVKVGFPR